MKKVFASTLLFLYCIVANAHAENPNYDKALADSLGGDDYGMKHMFL